MAYYSYHFDALQQCKSQLVIHAPKPCICHTGLRSFLHDVVDDAAESQQDPLSVEARAAARAAGEQAVESVRGEIKALHDAVMPKLAAIEAATAPGKPPEEQAQVDADWFMEGYLAHKEFYKVSLTTAHVQHGATFPYVSWCVDNAGWVLKVLPGTGLRGYCTKQSI